MVAADYDGLITKRSGVPVQGPAPPGSDFLELLLELAVFEVTDVLAIDQEQYVLADVARVITDAFERPGAPCDPQGILDVARISRGCERTMVYFKSIYFTRRKESCRCSSQQSP